MNSQPAEASVKQRLRRIGKMLLEAARGFQRHKAPRLGAALAFYTILSISPLLVLVLAILGFAFGEEAARGTIALQIEGLVGTQGAKAIEGLIANANKPSSGWLATIIGSAVLLFGASSLFVELKNILDTVWETPPQPSKGWGLRALLFERFLAFSAICGLAFLMLVSLVFSAVLNAIEDRIVSSADVEFLFARIANLTISFAVTFGLFAMIFKLLPTVRPRWSNVWFGSLATTVLFFVGKTLIGIYLGRAAIGSSYGAAGSLVVLLVWVYYSTQILLYGAELTHVSDMVLRPETKTDTSA